MHRKTARSLVAGLAGVALLSAGCSSPSEGGGGGGDATSSSSAAKSANQLIAEHSDMPQFTEPGPSIDTAGLKGKTIAIVAVDLRVPALAEVVANAKIAAKKVGLNITVFDAKSQATGMQQGMQQAIDNKADAIISDGLAIAVVKEQIKDAKDKGIPTVDVINTPPVKDVAGQGSDPNIFGNVAPDATLAGQLMVAAAVSQTDGKAQVTLMNTSEVTVSKTAVDSMTKAIADCEGCKVVSTTDTALNSWSTEIPGLVAAQVRSNPDVNFLLPIYDAMGIFATAGIQQAAAGGKVRIASQNGTPAALDLVKKGDIFVADVAQSTSWAAWAAVDQSMRGMLKLDPADPVLPIRYTDTKSLADVDTSSSDTVDAALFGTAYKDGYLKLWGLS